MKRRIVIISSPFIGPFISFYKESCVIAVSVLTNEINSITLNSFFSDTCLSKVFGETAPQVCVRAIIKAFDLWACIKRSALHFV